MASVPYERKRESALLPRGCSEACIEPRSPSGCLRGCGFCRPLRGPFSALSTRNSAKNYAVYRIDNTLQDKSAKNRPPLLFAIGNTKLCRFMSPGSFTNLQAPAPAGRQAALSCLGDLRVARTASPCFDLSASSQASGVTNKK